MAMGNFNFCETTYQRALKVMNHMVSIAEGDTKPYSSGLMQICDSFQNISAYEAIPEENLYLCVVNGTLRNLGAMYSYEAKLKGREVRVITISQPSIMLAGGRRKMSIKDKSHLFHEIIHHLDYMDGLVFDEDSKTMTIDLTAHQIVMNVNTYVEQRAYFYAHVFEMRSRMTYKFLKKIKALKPFIGNISKKHMIILHLMTPNNLAYHEMRINQLVSAEYQ